MQLFDFIEKHKIAFVIGMTLILFGLYMGVTNAIKASRADAADGNAEVSQVEAQEAGDGDEKTIDTAGLTEAQRSHVKNYSQEETAIIGQLASVPWRGTDGKGHLAFKPNGSFIQTAPSSEAANGAEKDEGSIAIVAVDGHAPGTVDDGSIITTSFIGLTSDGEYHVFHLTKISHPESETPNQILNFESDYFGDRVFTSEFAFEDLEIEGISKELKSAVDGNSRELEECLSDYVKAHHSSCNIATWDKTISFNYEAQTVLIGFELSSTIMGADDSPDSEFIAITYHLDTKTFEGGEM